MTPGAERAPATRWHRLLALSQRWYMRLVVAIAVVVAVALPYLRINIGLVVAADVVVYIGYFYVVGGQFLFFIHQMRFRPQPNDPRWGRWARPAIQLWFLAILFPMTFIALFAPFVLIYPALLDAPFKIVVQAAAYFAAAAFVVVMGPLLVFLVGALLVAVPIGITRAIARERRRRHYVYPPHPPRQ